LLLHSGLYFKIKPFVFQQIEPFFSDFNSSLTNQGKLFIIQQAVFSKRGTWPPEAIRRKRRMKKMIFLTFVLLLILSTSPCVYIYGDIPEEEREALIVLYNAANGDKWRNSSGWKEEPLEFDDFGPAGSEGNWKGITVSGGHVTKIVFKNNGLQGNIPARLGSLEKLEVLELQESSLQGSIPPELGNLNNLRVLILKCPDLTGSIPPELGKLSSLEVLFLGNSGLMIRTSNKKGEKISGGIKSMIEKYGPPRNWVGYIEGGIPPELGKLRNLKELSLCFTGLGGSIPPELGNLGNLQKLDLRNNHLTGTIPPQLGKLINLETLSLNYNELTGSIPMESGNLIRLKKLLVTNNRLNGSIPPTLGNLDNLEVLDLTGNRLSGTIPPELGNLGSIQDLNLSKNRLSGEIPPELGNLAALSFLYLSGNRLTGTIPPEMANPGNLKQLLLQSNRLQGPIPAGFSGLSCYLVNISYNGLYTGNDLVRRYLNRVAAKWMNTQTTAPTKVSAKALSADSIRVSWKPILYRQDPGGYMVYYSTNARGPWILAGITPGKKSTSFCVTGLNPGTTYYFIIQTRTKRHESNPNEVVSEYSKDAFATTLSRQ
jgi:Leucine-rich repeat (LRR) protein